jgi:hypothetical protein
MVETTMSKKNALLDILNFCYLLRTALKKEYFMDDPAVIAAINNNDHSQFTKLTNCFIGKALSHIRDFAPLFKYYSPMFKYIDDPKTEPDLQISIFTMDGLNRKHLGFPSQDNLVESTIKIKRIIIIQLIIWSVVSSETFKLIHAILFTFWEKKIDVNKLDQNVLWLWLQCLTRCIVSTTHFVYKMHATDHESKNPMCQLLLLEASIHHNSLPFLQFGISPSGHDMGVDDFKGLPWKDVTYKFVSYLHNTSQTSVLAKSDDKKTLVFFVECMGSTGVIESFTLDSFINNYLSRSRMMGKQHTLSHHKVLTPMEMLMSVAGATLFTLPRMPEAKHKSLHQNLKELMNEMDEQTNHRIWKLLEHNSRLQLKDKDKHRLQLKQIKESYLKLCDEFAETEFSTMGPKILKYMKKMISLSGLLIHACLKAKHDAMLDHENVLAQVLLHCITGCFSRNGKFIWLHFFKKLIPLSAHDENVKSLELGLLHLYYQQCLDKMSVQEVTREQFMYYFNCNILKNDKVLIENNLNVDLKNTEASIEKKKKKGKSCRKMRDESHSSSDKRMREKSNDTPLQSNDTPMKQRKRHCNFNHNAVSNAQIITTSKSLAKKKSTLKGAPATVVASSYYDFVNSTKLLERPLSSSQVSKQGRKQKVVRTSSPVSKPLSSSPKKSGKDHDDADSGKGDNMCKFSVKRLFF